MGLLSWLSNQVKSGGITDGEAAGPAESVGVCCPASGRLVALADVPDPVFAGGAMGLGAGIWPDEGVVVAPVSGVVTAVLETGHAVGITTDGGREFLVHVGVETVSMEGDGFECIVKEGQHVAVGDVLVRFDRDKVARAGYADVVICIALGAEDVELAVVPGNHVEAGTPIFKVR